jgi:hypothetical protein
VTIYTQTLGAFDPGVVSLDGSGELFSATNDLLNIPQVLMSNVSGGYQFNTSAGNTPASVVLQSVKQNPGVAIPFTPVFTASPFVYNAAAEVAVINMTPLSTTSVFQVSFAVSVYQTTAPSIVYCSAFLNATTSLFIEDNQADDGGLTNFSTPMTASGSFTTGTLAPFTVNFCMFQGFAATNVQSLVATDWFQVDETNAITTIPTYPTVVSTSSTPLLIQSYPIAVSQSLNIRGTINMVDQANVLSVIGQFLIVGQRGVSGNPTLIPQIYNANALSPTLQWGVTPTTITASVIGVNGKTYYCQINSQTVTS